ncbi:MAG: AAA-associated domain-containing protein [Thermoplasmata archaeon]
MESIEPNARIADLVGLLYVLNFIFKDKTDLFELEKEMEVDLDDLLPIVYTASTLGFVNVTDGDISITQKGKEYIGSSPKKRRVILANSLDNVEPFYSALKLGSFKVEDLSTSLEENGIQTYNTPSGNRDLEITLIEWGLYSGLLKKTDEGFEVMKVSSPS